MIQLRVGLVALLFVPCALLGQNHASTTAPLAWSTDFPKAVKDAKSQDKSVLLFFHGGNWCPPCIEMQRQVIQSPEFADYARKSLILLDVDFPENDSQSEALKQSNLALKAKFNLSPASGEGYPTIVLLNSEGQTVFQETGYSGGGPAEVLAKLRQHTDSTASSNSMPGYVNLNADEFAKLAADKSNVILDVRTTSEFSAGHIAGALNLDVNAPDFQQKAAALDKSKTYLVHCASGVRSVKACESLDKLGFLKLYNLTGGYHAWTKAGKPVEK